MRKRWIAATVLACMPCATPPLAAQTVVISNVTVIDMTDRPPRVASVIVRNGRIAAIEAQALAPAGAIGIDGRGKFLIPGLWDMHVHVADIGVAGLGLFTAHGVTGVRDMGGNAPRLLTLL